MFTTYDAFMQPIIILQELYYIRSRIYTHIYIYIYIYEVIFQQCYRYKYFVGAIVTSINMLYDTVWNILPSVHISF